MSFQSSTSRRQRMLSIVALAILVAPAVLGAALRLGHAHPAAVIGDHGVPAMPPPATGTQR